ncbi:MAG: NYN domain-containing protein [Candidatus Heimdallarchaeaceae archaeon]
MHSVKTSYWLVLTWLVLFIGCSTVPLSLAHINPQSISTFQEIEIIPHQLVNASFFCYLESEDIIRGQDDLIIYFQFSFENGSFIPDAKIHYNITNPLGTKIIERTLQVNTSATFNEIIIWPNFNSQPEGNYTITAIANSSFTPVYILQRQFHLSILATGFLRMFFPLNPVYLQRNTSNYVNFTMTNVGGSTVSNISISIALEVQGTEGNLIIPFIPSLQGLNLSSGASYHDIIEFFPDTFLYKKLKFSLVYRTIDDPLSEKFAFSDALEIVVLPNVSIAVNAFPANVTVDEDYTITFNITNNENSVLFIAPHAQCNLITFEDYEVIGTIRVSPLWHQFTIVGTPNNEGQTAIWFWIDLEWRDGNQVLYYSTILETIIVTVTILPSSHVVTYYSYQIIAAIILTALAFSIMYFSRELVKGIVKRVRQTYPYTIPEVVYPLDTVILDGSNIAWEEKNIDGRPKISNIEAMINKLSRANFTKIICVADAALRYQIDNQKRLDELIREGAIKMLPARVDGDKFILRLAEEENAMIVTNDLFKEYRDIAPWIDERRIPYTILNGEVYLHPISPSSIDEIKHQNKNEKVH